MNKLLIVLLAVCLVSVHAFVKRNAETPAPNANQGLDQLKDFAVQAGKQIQSFLDPENLKKTINEGIDNFNKAIADLQSKKEETKQ